MTAQTLAADIDKNQLERYSRHILLPEIDIAGQQRLLQSRVLVVGAGGLGSPVLMYLASSGVGHLVINDFDQVDLSNLQRQIIHGHHDIGRDKVSSAKTTISSLNPDVHVTTIEKRLHGAELRREVRLADVVVDASDNFTLRFALNQCCVEEKIPLVSGAVVRMKGQVTVIDPRQPDSPCYYCLYHDSPEEQENCGQSGVLAPLAGIVGSIQATEALKILLSMGQPLIGRLAQIDARTMEWRTVRLPKDPHCPVCSH